MKKTFNKMKNNIHAKRALAIFLTLAVFLSLFAGCSFGTSSDTCDDPNCTSCYNVYADEITVSDSVIADCGECTGGGAYELVAVDCPNCTNGIIASLQNVTCSTCTGTGSITTTTWVNCSTCGGDNLVTCTTCGGDGYTSSNTNAIYSCPTCGSDQWVYSSSEAGSGTVACTASSCVNGKVASSSSSSCSSCGGDGLKYEYVYTNCTACTGGNTYTSVWVDCTTCDGYGCFNTLNSSGCSLCDYSGLEVCTTCTGLGYTSSNSSAIYSCPTCGTDEWVYSASEAGTGYVACSYCTDGCSTCDYTEEIDCLACDGLGYNSSSSSAVLSCYLCGTGEWETSSANIGSGKVGCPDCTGTVIYTVTYIYDSTSTIKYGFAGEILPSFSSLENQFYYSTDEAGDYVVSESTLLTFDRTLYVQDIYTAEPTDKITVSYYTFDILSESGWELYSQETVFAGYSITPPVVADITYNDVEYEFVGWVTSKPSFEFDWSWQSLLTQPGFDGSDELIDISTFTSETDVKLYAIYDNADNEGPTSLEAFGVDIYSGEYNFYVYAVIIIIVIVVILLFLVVIK